MLITLLRLQLLAFGLETFAYATVSSRRKYMSDKDRAFSPLYGFKENPTLILMKFLG